MPSKKASKGNSTTYHTSGRPQRRFESATAVVSSQAGINMNGECPINDQSSTVRID